MTPLPANQRPVSQVTTLPAQQLWKLPPLILHPFSDSSGPNKLVESSRASMMIQGLLPSDNMSMDQLDIKLLDGRYCEIHMLFYVGRDLIRSLGGEAKPVEVKAPPQQIVELTSAQRPLDGYQNISRGGNA